MGGQRMRREQLVASYADPSGRPHRIVLRGRLVLDLCGRRPAVLVAELSLEEGLEQARAAVLGGEFDPGYLARAQAGESPLGRRLSAAELGDWQSHEAEDGGEERRLAA